MKKYGFESSVLGRFRVVSLFFKDRTGQGEGREERARVAVQGLQEFGSQKQKVRG